MSLEKQIAAVMQAMRRTKQESLQAVLDTLTTLKSIEEELYSGETDEEKVAAHLEKIFIGS